MDEADLNEGEATAQRSGASGLVRVYGLNWGFRSNIP